MERLTKRNTCSTPNFTASKEIMNDQIARSAFYAQVAEKLATYEDAEEQGRIFVSLCKLGDKDAQCDAILEYIKTYGEISHSEALSQFGCMDLDCRVESLMRRGIPIVGAWKRKLDNVSYVDNIFIRVYRMDCQSTK